MKYLCLFFFYIFHVLKSIMKFNNPITIRERHDISFFPKECTIRTFYLNRTNMYMQVEWNYSMCVFFFINHVEFAQCLHCIDLSRGFQSNKIDCTECTSTENFNRFEITKIYSLITNIFCRTINYKTKNTNSLLFCSNEKRFSHFE